jgi:hypothetical protein
VFRQNFLVTIWVSVVQTRENGSKADRIEFLMSLTYVLVILELAEIICHLAENLWTKLFSIMNQSQDLSKVKFWQEFLKSLWGSVKT